MILAAIYNVWDGVELLKGSIDCLKKDVDLFIIVYQDVSNFGERYDPLPEIEKSIKGINNVKLLKYTPNISGGQVNEIQKRNFGLKYANSFGCTHFLHLDTDEYYENFADAKNLYIKSGYKGSVCRILTYFKLPTLRLENEDGYFVPFIHELLPETVAGGNNYPYYVDRTRRINCIDVTLLPVTMHHFSWIRSDIGRKCRNSSAKNNIKTGTLLTYYHDPALKYGDYIQDFEQKLIDTENIFNIKV